MASINSNKNLNDTTKCIINKNKKLRFNFMLMFFLIQIWLICILTTKINCSPINDRSSSSFASSTNSLGSSSSQLAPSGSSGSSLPYPETEIMDNIAKLASSPFARNYFPGESNEINSNENQLILNKLLGMLERKRLPPNWIVNQALLSGQHKRQIRYQQCYFNPISCF